MDRKDLVKKILELSLELKDAEGVQAMMCITDMENVVKDYEKQLRLYNVSQQRELLLAYHKYLDSLNDPTVYNASESMIDDYLANNCS